MSSKRSDLVEKLVSLRFTHMRTICRDTEEEEGQERQERQELRGR